MQVEMEGLPAVKIFFNRKVFRKERSASLRPLR